MNDGEAFDFIYDYFYEVFNKRDINALDIYLDEKYWDDDIGAGSKNHIRDSKEFLADLFRRNSSIAVDVTKVMVKDEVITAYLEWFDDKDGEKTIIWKGIGIFTVKNKRILKRHTYIYYRG